MYYSVGTGFCAKTAADTTTGIYFSYVFLGIYAYGISGTNINAITVAKAGKVAESVTRKAHVCSLTALGSVIAVLSLIR